MWVAFLPSGVVRREPLMIGERKDIQSSLPLHVAMTIVYLNVHSCGLSNCSIKLYYYYYYYYGDRLVQVYLEYGYCVVVWFRVYCMFKEHAVCQYLLPLRDIWGSTWFHLWAGLIVTACHWACLRRPTLNFGVSFRNIWKHLLIVHERRSTTGLLDWLNSRSHDM